MFKGPSYLSFPHVFSGAEGILRRSPLDLWKNLYLWYSDSCLRRNDNLCVNHACVCLKLIMDVS